MESGQLRQYLRGCMGLRVTAGVGDWQLLSAHRRPAASEGLSYLSSLDNTSSEALFSPSFLVSQAG